MRGAEFSADAKRFKADGSNARVRTVTVSHTTSSASVEGDERVKAGGVAGPIGEAMESRLVDGGAATSVSAEGGVEPAAREALARNGRSSAVPPPARTGAPSTTAGAQPPAKAGSMRPNDLTTSLSDHVVFNDEKLARKYASESIPISILYEAYFDGGIDIPGDLVEFLEQRSGFVKHTITRQHLQWAVTNFVPEMVAHSREADARTARELYDERGEEFFRAFLGERMAFTCALFESRADSLEIGSDRLVARVCEKIGLRASHRVLDVGAGFGAFLAHMARTRGAEGVGVTLSELQASYANQRFRELGVERQVHVQVGDYRDLPAEKFDRIVSIEAVERVGVKNLKAFFEKLHDRLHDDGLFFLQWTGLRRQLRPEDLMWGLFINKHVFPGADAGLPLSSMLKVAEKSGWEVRDVQNVSSHYSETLRLWRANWQAQRERIVSQYGERWYRIWHFFLAWSQIVGEQGSAGCYQVVMNKNLDSFNRRPAH